MSNSRQLVKVGADPELFVEDLKGRLRSVIGKLGGTKKAPIPVKELGKGFAYQEDNVLAEYNIPPSEDGDLFRAYNRKMIAYLQTKLKEVGLRPRWTASEVMPEEEMQNELAFVFGCDPDFNVYTLEMNPRPECPNPLFRCAGGHLHVGFKMNNADKVNVGRAMDVWLGLWSVIQDPDTRRRSLYGKAGSIRFKPYGLEYRTLSNFWLKDLYGEVYNRTIRAVHAGMNKEYDFNKHADKVQMAINESNKELAAELMGELGVS